MKHLLLYVFIGLAILLLIIALAIFWRRRLHRPSGDYFAKRWKDLQKNCATRKTWPLAIIDADNLLDEALKRGNYKGKTTGERLVAAQHTLSSNHSVWFGHKLRNRIAQEDIRKLKKKDIISALNGFRQALRDLGALEHDKS